MRKRNLTDTELKAWQRVTRYIRPLEPNNSARALETISEIEAETKEAKKTLVPSSSATPSGKTPAKPKMRKPSTLANRKAEKRVRRGKVDIDATLDLHGLTVVQAMQRLSIFVSAQHNANARTLLIITGKGHPSEGKIRREFRLWLERPDTKTCVSGYSESHAKHGGAGAFYVFLRSAAK